MNKVFTVAHREYVAGVKTKAFLISLFLMPLLMCGGALAQWMLKDQVDLQEKRFAVIDRTPQQRLARSLKTAADARNAHEIKDAETGKQIKPVFAVEQVEPGPDTLDAVSSQRFELSERVRRGELFGFFEIGARVFDLPSTTPSAKTPSPTPPSDSAVLRYQSNSPTYDDFQKWARPILEREIQEARFQAANLPAAEVRAVLQSPPLVVKGLSTKSAKTGAVEEAKDENPIVSLLAPAALMIMMFMLIFIGGTPAMQGVVEEKMQRIAEMVLGSVRPFELMLGKLLGLMSISLTLAALYLGAGYWLAAHYGMTELVSPWILGWFVLYLVVGVIMYGALFIAVGAACSDLRDTQTMLWPVMLLAMLPMFVWVNVAREPTSTFSTVSSFIPTATPMLMLLRLAVPPGIPWWQPAVGLVLMLLTTLLFVYAAGRIFRVGILMQGKGASTTDLARWIIRG